MLIEAYGGHALSRAHCFRWFEKFRSGDFSVENEDCDRPLKKFEDAELQTLLDEDDCQTQEMMAEELGVTQKTISKRFKDMGMISKVGRWVPHELTEKGSKRAEKPLVNAALPVQKEVFFASNRYG